MQITPYLNFSGDCREAFTFYQQVLGGEIQDMIAHSDMPMDMPIPPEWADKIMHASLRIGDAILMASDAPSEHYSKPQGMYVSIHPKTPEEAERIYAALSEKGTIEMELQQTPWAARFAMFTDRFGIPWMIDCGQAE